MTRKSSGLAYKSPLTAKTTSFRKSPCLSLCSAYQLRGEDTIKRERERERKKDRMNERKREREIE